MLNNRENLTNQNLQGKYILLAEDNGYFLGKIEKLSIVEQHTLDQNNQTVFIPMWIQTEDGTWIKSTTQEKQIVTFTTVRRIFTPQELTEEYFDLLL